MINPQFSLLPNEFNNKSDENKLLKYLNKINNFGRNVCFRFHFSSDHEFKIIALQNDLRNKDFTIVMQKSETHRGKPTRWYLIIEKTIELEHNNLLIIVNHLKNMAKIYTVDFYKIEPAVG